MRTLARALAVSCLLAVAFAGPSVAATNATDPVGDVSGAAGFDLTGVSDRVDVDGTAHITITRSGTTCSSMHYPEPVIVQPHLQFMSAGSTAPSEAGTGNAGAAYAVSTTTDYVWSPLGGTGSDTDVPLVETVTDASVVVTIPAAQLAAAGGLPLRSWVSNSCRSHWSDPVLSVSDKAPNSGLFTLEPYDACPNLAGAQASVPAGSFVDAAGSCVVDVCVNIDGGQAAAPSGFGLVPTQVCVRITFAGSAAANTLIGNALANVISGLGGNDRLSGRGGNDTLRGGAGIDLLLGELGDDRLFGDAGVDTARGGAGRDQLTGGLGKDKLYGDAGNDILYGNDRAAGDVVNGGLGTDTCWYDTGDVLVGCERKVRKA